jgi:hypothetical protein
MRKNNEERADGDGDWEKKISKMSGQGGEDKRFNEILFGP